MSQFISDLTEMYLYGQRVILVHCFHIELRIVRALNNVSTCSIKPVHVLGIIFICSQDIGKEDLVATCLNLLIKLLIPAICLGE